MSWDEMSFGCSFSQQVSSLKQKIEFLESQNQQTRELLSFTKKINTSLLQSMKDDSENQMYKIKYALNDLKQQQQKEKIRQEEHYEKRLQKEKQKIRKELQIKLQKQKQQFVKNIVNQYKQPSRDSTLNKTGKFSNISSIHMKKNFGSPYNQSSFISTASIFASPKRKLRQTIKAQIKCSHCNIYYYEEQYNRHYEGCLQMNNKHKTKRQQQSIISIILEKPKKKNNYKKKK